VPMATPVQHAHVHAHAASHRSIERRIVRLVNRVRRRHGLPPLFRNSRLTFVAGLHSLDLARHNELSHNSSNGQSFVERLHYATHARVIGETIAEVSGRGSARTVVRAWMHSPPHRAELLCPSFRAIGVGSVRWGGARFVTADFAS
jgi:uncharacterized protein YkwD